jgi:hypothetical protein
LLRTNMGSPFDARGFTPARPDESTLRLKTQVNLHRFRPSRL